MKELLRLLSFARRYTPHLLASVVLMAAAGAATGMIPLLIGPILYKVLDIHAPDEPIHLYTIPLLHRTIDLNQIVPVSIHNMASLVAFAIVAVFLIKGLCDYFGNYLVNYVGFSAVTNLRNTVFDKVLKQGAEFFEAHSTGRLMSSIMNDIDKVQLATSHILADFLRQIFMAVALLLVVIGKDPQLAIISFLVLPLVVLPTTAHRAQDPPHHPQHAGAAGRTEPDLAGNPERPHGGEGIRRRGLRIAPLPGCRAPAAQNQSALREAASHLFAADRNGGRAGDRGPADLRAQPDQVPTSCRPWISRASSSR